MKKLEIFTVENIKKTLILKSDFFHEIDLSNRSILLLYTRVPFFIACLNTIHIKYIQCIRKNFDRKARIFLTKNCKINKIQP